MNDDRELLEKAAKAAGYKLDGLAEPFCASVAKGSMLLLNERGGHSVWNPLTDDGDALRLAVKLRMSFDYRQDDSVNAEIYHPDRMNTLEWEACGSDPYAATRRAIVRAAASLAKEGDQQ